MFYKVNNQVNTGNEMSDEIIDWYICEHKKLWLDFNLLNWIIILLVMSFLYVKALPQQCLFNGIWTLRKLLWNLYEVIVISIKEI